MMPNTAPPALRLHADPPARPAATPSNVWVVVPAYNEAGRIGEVLAQLLEHWPNIAVVDDGSKDDTAAEIAKHPVWLLRHVVNLGQGAALQTAIRFALGRKADYIVTFDADRQHRVEDIPLLLKPLEDGTAEFSLGSRFLGHTEGMPLSRRLVLRAAVLFTRVFSGIRLTDVHNGLRAMTRRGASELRLTLNRMEHASQLLEQVQGSGLPFVETPVTIRYTADSLAKGQKSSAAVRMAMNLLLERIAG